MSVFKTAAIFAKSSPDLKGPLEALAALVTQSGVSLLVDETASQILADPVRFPPNSVQTIGEKADVAIVLGGDGTTLGIGRRLAQYDCPIIGINAGRLGFITDVVLEEMSRVIPLMLEGHYVRDPRPIIEGSVLHEGRVVYQSNAVNDIGITHGKIGGMVEYTIYVNGLQMSSQRADGIIYATTTGSTASSIAPSPLRTAARARRARSCFRLTLRLISSSLRSKTARPISTCRNSCRWRPGMCCTFTSAATISRCCIRPGITTLIFFAGN